MNNNELFDLLMELFDLLKTIKMRSEYILHMCRGEGEMKLEAEEIHRLVVEQIDKTYKQRKEITSAP